MNPTTVKALCSKEDPSDKSYIIGIVFGVIGTVLIIVAICYFYIKNGCNCNKYKPSYNYDDEDDYEYEYVPAIAKIKKRKY